VQHGRHATHFVAIRVHAGHVGRNHPHESRRLAIDHTAHVVRDESGTEIVFEHLMEGIGIALDVPGARMFMTDLGGSVYEAALDGSERRVLGFVMGNLSGIAFVSFT